MVIRLGRRDGFRTLNVVRRREQGEELLRKGADAVVCTADEALAERVREITRGAGVPFALEAVGGETGSEVMRWRWPQGGECWSTAQLGGAADVRPAGADRRPEAR